MKRQLRDLIKQRGLTEFVSIDPKSSILKALEVLESTNSSALMVTENHRLKGIFTEKDFARAALRRDLSLSAKVESVMTSRVYYAEQTFTLEECLQIMSRVRVRHLPVIENGQPIAIVSMRHIMEVLVDDKDTLIRDLTTYITGATPVSELYQNQRNFINIPIYFSNQSQEAV